MSATFARRFYISALFVLMSSNALAGLMASMGVRGIAFYHVEAIILLLCAAQAGVLLVGGRIRLTIDGRVLGWIFAYAVYTVISGILWLRFADVSIAYVALIVHTLLFYPLTAVLLIVCARAGDELHVPHLVFPRWISCSAGLVIGFGWLQFLLHDPILRSANNERVSRLVEASTLGTFRPPSVFESSFQFGVFSVLVFSLTVPFAVRRPRSVRLWMLAVLGLSGISLSQTRNVFVCASAAAVSLFLVYRIRTSKRGSGVLKCAPMFYMTAAVGVLVYAIARFLNSGLSKTGDLSDASSTWARVSSWMKAGETLVLPGSITDALFGYGITQAGHATDYGSLYPIRAEGLFIDSTFVNLFLLQGIIGLFIFLMMYWVIWKKLLRRTVESWDPLSIGVTAFFSCFLAAGVFNILNGQWWGISLALSLFVLVSGRKEREACAM